MLYTVYLLVLLDTWPLLVTYTYIIYCQVDTTTPRHHDSTQTWGYRYKRYYEIIKTSTRTVLLKCCYNTTTPVPAHWRTFNPPSLHRLTWTKILAQRSKSLSVRCGNTTCSWSVAQRLGTTLKREVSTLLCTRTKSLWACSHWFISLVKFGLRLRFSEVRPWRRSEKL